MNPRGTARQHPLTQARTAGDGYDESNYFHCNWGWGGSANGYYYLDPLSENSISFIENQAALLNILPEGLEEPLALFEFEIEDLEVMFSDLSSIINSERAKVHRMNP